MKYLAKEKYIKLKEEYTKEIVNSVITEGFSNIERIVGNVIQTITVERENLNKRRNNE